VTGLDPAATNSSPQLSPVQIQTNSVSNPVMIPEYSVVRLEWTVFNVPAPALSLIATNSTQVFAWTGLTNVTYSLQGKTNLTSAWSTLGKVASTQPGFSFTNWNSGAMQFYRLVVP